VRVAVAGRELVGFRSQDGAAASALRRPPSHSAAIGGHPRECLSDLGTAHIEPHTLADFLAGGELDRHLRRMQGRY
jgi:hypothetical protein